MCICINCRHVHNCTTYQLIKKKHQYQKEDENTKSPLLFIPISTLIHINIDRSNSSCELDWDLVECLSFAEQPGKWLYV